MRSIIGVLYVVIGVLIASDQGYLGDIGGFGDVLNLALAILLWPLLLLGVDFNVKIGGGDQGRPGALLPYGLALASPRPRSASHLRAAVQTSGRGVGINVPYSIWFL